MSEKLRVGGLNPLSTIDAEGISFVIYFQGCSRGCPNCHNPELQSFNGGKETTNVDILMEINRNKEWYTSVVLQGGEPLQQDHFNIACLMRSIKSMGLEVWLYTGFDEKDIPDNIKKYCDVIKAGAYIEELKTGGFPASKNQAVIDRRKRV
jgi:anaerobic ribonucleoside-triphosphate reductase activating protein